MLVLTVAVTSLGYIRGGGGSEVKFRNRKWAFMTWYVIVFLNLSYIQLSKFKFPIRHYRDHLCGLVVRVPGCRSRGPEIDSRHYQIFWDVVGLERGALSLVNTIVELLWRKSGGSNLENPEYGRRGPLCWPRKTLYPQKLALTSPTSSGHSVGIISSRTKATAFVILYTSLPVPSTYSFLHILWSCLQLIWHYIISVIDKMSPNDKLSLQISRIFFFYFLRFN
jgi:hypothetical protein